MLYVPDKDNFFNVSNDEIWVVTLMSKIVVHTEINAHLEIITKNLI